MRSAVAIGPKLNAPAEPPEPSPRKLPFHVVAGIQTSTPIAEVPVGASVAATRQNAGRFISVGGDPGTGVKVPAGTDCVVMAVVPGGEPTRGSRTARPPERAWAAGRRRGRARRTRSRTSHGDAYRLLQH